MKAGNQVTWIWSFNITIVLRFEKKTKQNKQFILVMFLHMRSSLFFTTTFGDIVIHRKRQHCIYTSCKDRSNKYRFHGGAVHTKIDLSWSIWDRSQFALRKCSHSFRSILGRSQFAFDRSHSDNFGLRSISDRSNSLVWMAPEIDPGSLWESACMFTLV